MANGQFDNKHYKVALYIGRFQPFHNGHLYSLKKAIEVGEKVIIGIGSSQENGTDSNPWSYQERREMVYKTIEGENIDEKSIAIVPVPDFPTDQEWVQYIESRIVNKELPKEDMVVVSNNEWTLSVLRKAGYPVLESGLFNRDELEGVKIRDMMRWGDEGWKGRVPDSVRRFVGDTAVRRTS